LRNEGVQEIERVGELGHDGILRRSANQVEFRHVRLS
jgi:hypothetical protein